MCILPVSELGISKNWQNWNRMKKHSITDLLAELSRVVQCLSIFAQNCLEDA